VISNNCDCSPSLVNKIVQELKRERVLFQEKKNKLCLMDFKRLLFKFANEWSMGEYIKLDLPFSTPKEVGDFLSGLDINFGFTLLSALNKGGVITAWVDDCSKLLEYENNGVVHVFVNKNALRGGNGFLVSDVQIFADLFSQGGFGIDLALSFGLKKGLLQ